MKNLWKTGLEHSSRDAWIQVNKELKNNGPRTSISRASAINFLNRMVDEGILGYHETTGKGGHRRIYKAKQNEQEFWAYVTQLVSEKLSNAVNSNSK